MPPLCYLRFLLLCCLPSSGLSLHCNQNQYAWPTESPTVCCDKCSPGSHMESRPPGSCKINCKPCTGDRFMDSHNVEMSCKVCDICNKPNFVTETNCTSTRNTVCKCQTGYTCTDETCTKCELIPTPTNPTPATNTAAMRSTTSRVPNQPIKDTVLFLVIVVLLCAGIILVALTKMKPLLHWVRSNHGYFLAKKPSSGPSSSEDVDVSKPIQEVCGKCDQPLEICIKD
ncbi:CD27 molecule [Nothobranchius furzeri]|uniref:CD27 molecule n=1 Tax=Nothobranchius furzeri TaxID=105023 RepID=A0A1A8A4R3_NOTFU|nr:CD27 molecule [Nothobranchius furzeri]